MLLFLVPLLLSQPSFPQADPLAHNEASLKELFEQLYLAGSDTEKKQLNDSILQVMTRLMASPGSFGYPFDSLSRIGNVISPDNAFRIFTWNIPLSGFVHEYHGIIQVNAGKKPSCQVFLLQDQARRLEDLLHAGTTAENWPGMLYYEVLRSKAGRDVIYTLIGYHFNDRFSDKKIIDVMYFDENQEPVFGRPVFQTEDGIQHRVIFEYSGEVVMTVRYNPDMKMIVYDHLSPIEPELEGNLRFYAPDFSYDGYRWKSGMWIHQSDIDVRNR
ncbi:MAG: hypothetical protein AMS26_04330 [Bacteroides sp. SM23_62]|nr:MAG: hypothetical protein AMS26_04330 [Bacteroides sp. SM23_62]